jgi:hypothetical protein
MTTKVVGAGGLLDWSLTAVYEPQGGTEKMQFLGKMRWIKHSVSEKWLIIWDFNMILQARDKSNANLNRWLMRSI